jgi:hypothetical protein
MVLNVLDPNENIATGQAACTQSNEPGFAFQGQMPLLLMSKYPLANTKAYNYPSTGLRRGILKAQVQFENNLTVDVFCTQLISPQIDTELPYVGPYGQDTEDGGNGWADEQALQAKRAVSWIQSEVKADGVPAVILGGFYSSYIPGSPPPAPTDGGLSQVGGTISPAVLQALDKTLFPSTGAFDRAEPPGYTRLCDTCPQNPYTPNVTPFEFDPAFTYNFPAGFVTTSSESLWATENSVQLTSTQYEQAPAGGYGPLSEYYAHNWQINRPAGTSSDGGAGTTSDAAAQ